MFWMVFAFALAKEFRWYVIPNRFLNALWYQFAFGTVSPSILKPSKLDLGSIVVPNDRSSARKNGLQGVPEHNLHSYGYLRSDKIDFVILLNAFSEPSWTIFALKYVWRANWEHPLWILMYFLWCLNRCPQADGSIINGISKITDNSIIHFSVGSAEWRKPLR